MAAAWPPTIEAAAPGAAAAAAGARRRASAQAPSARPPRKSPHPFICDSLVVLSGQPRLQRLRLSSSRPSRCSSGGGRLWRLHGFEDGGEALADADAEG